MWDGLMAVKLFSYLRMVKFHSTWRRLARARLLPPGSPDSQNPWRNGAYAVLAQAGFGAISNWLQEFALDLGHKLSRNKGAKDSREP